MAGGNTLDLTRGSVAKKVLLFAIPIMLGNILQQLYGIADRVVVGQFAANGSLALAAVGATSSPIYLTTDLFIGIATGVNVICANLLGANKRKALRDAMHTGILLSVICGLAVGLFGIFASRQILLWMDTPSDVLEQGTLYMQIYFLSVPASLVYNFGAGILRAHGDTKRPTWILIISGLVNVALNFLLVIVFHLDVAGVAIATAFSQVISAVMVLWILFRPAGEFKLKLGQLKFHKEHFLTIIRVGLPSGLGSTCFSISNVILQSALNSFDDPNIIAGKAAAIDVTSMLYQVLAAMLAACVSFAGQCYGAKNYKRVDKLVITATALSYGLLGGLIALSSIFAPQLIRLFNEDPDVIHYGTIILVTIGLGYLVYVPGEIFQGCSRGMRRATVPMLLNLLGICVTRLIWIWVVFPQHHTVLVLYLCYPISWTISAALQIGYYIIMRRNLNKKLRKEQAKTG